MVDAARAAQSAPPNLRFVVGDIAEWTPDADTDVVVSNAALQWVPGHDDLIRQWMRTLPAGAWLAFQVPGNFGAPSHRLMRQLAQSPRWAHELRDALRVHDEALEPDAYAQIALDAGWRPDVWETTYMHLLGGTDPVLEWVRGTGLRPIVAALRPQDRADFEAEYARQLRGAYPARRQRASIAGSGFARAEERHEHTTNSAEQSGTAPDEVTFFPFRRIFCVAQRD
jgi:trans-aconitate 2-methyltransferase